jgi:hypothetical protein
VRYVGSSFGVTFDDLVKEYEEDLLGEDLYPDWPHKTHTKVDTGHWQGLKNVPHTQTRELQYKSFEYQIPQTMGQLLDEIKPNYPWAEDHFQERVGGEPLNPGEQYKNWPWYKGGVEDHKKTGQFSHTYMERYWPKEAILASHDKRDCHGGPDGIRYYYGDLQDVVNLLAREPTTRQAYLPVWFPEDTGACGTEQQRVPCSLGYHFMMRDGKLNCMYHMRSCDLIRYFRDDVYLTCRLVQWLIDAVHKQEDTFDQGRGIWHYVKPGALHMTIASLHIFEGDVPMLRRKYGVS